MSYTQPIRLLSSWDAVWGYPCTIIASIFAKTWSWEVTITWKKQVVLQFFGWIEDSDSLISHEKEPFFSGARCESQGNISCGSAPPKVRFLWGQLESSELHGVVESNQSSKYVSHGIISPLQICRVKLRKTISWNHQVNTEIHSLKLTWRIPFFNLKGNFESMIFLLLVP